MARFIHCFVVVAALLVTCTPAWSAEEGGGHKGGGGHGHIGSEGVSQDPSEFKTDLAIWTLIVFLGLFGLLHRFAWGPISEGLEKRESSIRQNIAEAESARIKAEKMLAEHAARLDKVQDEVKEILAEARRDADVAKNDIIATAQKEAEATKQRAVTEIGRAKDQALDELFDHMGKCVREATEKVLGRSLTGADHERLIKESLSGFANSKN